MRKHCVYCGLKKHTTIKGKYICESCQHKLAYSYDLNSKIKFIAGIIVGSVITFFVISI